MSGAGSAQLASAVAARLAGWADQRVAERLWARDGSLWAASGKPAEEVSAWLGWLELPVSMRERVGELERMAREVRADGYTRAAVLGMGGSSLAPELFSRVFGWFVPYSGSIHPAIMELGPGHALVRLADRLHEREKEQRPLA